MNELNKELNRMSRLGGKVCGLTVNPHSSNAQLIPEMTEHVKAVNDVLELGTGRDATKLNI